MPFSLSKLFKSKQSPSDGLSQPQREAIVDLLHLCMYADNMIALAEAKVMTDVVDSFAWEATMSFESYETHSISAARTAKEDEDARKTLLESVSSRLNTPHSRAVASKVCKQLMVADGTTEKEAVLLATIKQVLG
jgi:K+-sensing histidine kinase KdpD